MGKIAEDDIMESQPPILPPQTDIPVVPKKKGRKKKTTPPKIEETKTA